MVRECTPDDMDWLVEKAIEFNTKHYDIPLNPDKLWNYLWAVIASEDGVAIRSDHGAIVGMYVEDPLRDWSVLVETAWYSTGLDGIRLLNAFERRGQLVDEVRMSHLHVNPTVAKLLERRGYVAMETSHRLIT